MDPSAGLGRLHGSAQPARQWRNPERAPPASPCSFARTRANPRRKALKSPAAGHQPSPSSCRWLQNLGCNHRRKPSSPAHVCSQGGLWQRGRRTSRWPGHRPPAALSAAAASQGSSPRHSSRKAHLPQRRGATCRRSGRSPTRSRRAQRATENPRHNLHDCGPHKQLSHAPFKTLKACVLRPACDLACEASTHVIIGRRASPVDEGAS